MSLPAAMLAAFLLRAGAIFFGWHLPKYQGHNSQKEHARM
jgi:uncharacterized membrane protein YeiH